MDFRELSAFVAVVEEGGMSAASRRLHVSQSALSQTVSALERELGVTLLERTSTGVHATEAGAVLLVEARAVLARYHQAAADDEHLQQRIQRGYQARHPVGTGS